MSACLPAPPAAHTLRDNWTCPLCEDKAGPFEVVCPRCGLTQKESFDVVIEIANDIDSVVEAIRDREHLGG